MIKRTTNPNLQAALDAWTGLLSQAQAAPSKGSGSDSSAGPWREDIIDHFVRTFVPLDVEEADIEHYSSSLKHDQEFFESLVREMGQCSTGNNVESILTASNVDPVRNINVDRATFVLLPPPGTVSDEADFEVVRELSFVSLDRGVTWRAEG